MTKQENRLGQFLREVSNWTWLDFVKAENDQSYTSNQAMIFALVRACAMRNLQAIRLTTNRLDGKLATPLKIEMPKVFYLYPNATLPELPVGNEPEVIPASKELIVANTTDDDAEELATLSIRQTVAKMADYSRELPAAICESAEQIEQFVRNQGPMPGDNPAVKSVMAAHLLTMAANRSIDALGEVFDQIDGKLAETFKVLGEDVYITNYGSVAPPGAYLNEDGVVELVALNVQDMWAAKLGREL